MLFPLALSPELTFISSHRGATADKTRHRFIDLAVADYWQPTDDHFSRLFPRRQEPARL